MENLKNNNKVLFIPGWLDNGERHGYLNSLNIWSKKVDIDKDFKTDYVIAHSIGALVALYNWKAYKNFKIILVNPVVLKKDIFKRWYKFVKSEGLPNSFKKSINKLNIILPLIKAISLFKTPAFDVVNSMPKESLIIIYGENDIHLFDRELLNKAREKGFVVQMVKGAGHNYGEELDRAVLKFI